ncbi:DMT family transporter [Sinisalibacter lacisalsi]|uniref:Membrane protein n=1 Tax=Sinisalibacter lacisalsi TaxID=1526570 RepID=A0ABQ1QWP6_9RHOB|nr:DMT family transporter [Sinisalibacter lacisalsi]GGD45038.1 membrane protein [Sinisalibacter lacisalsi]
MPDHLKGLLITGLGVLLIVPDSLFVRLIDASALTIAFWRSLLTAGTIALGVLVFQGPGAFRAILRLGPGIWLYIVSIGITGFLFVLAVSLTSVANVVFILAAMPAFAALLSWIFLGEGLSRRTAITIATVVFGIGIIAFGSGETAHASLAGDLVALTVAVVFAVALTTARKLKASSMVPAIPIGYFGAAIVLFPFAEPMSVPDGDWIWIALHGGVFIAGATAFISLGPRYLPSAEVALLILVESVLAPLLAWVVLAENPGRWALVGGALVLGALAVSNAMALRERRRVRAAPGTSVPQPLPPRRNGAGRD